jgi:hypothetical protein
MALAFGRVGKAQQGASAPASPIVVTVTINAGETGIAVICFAATTPGAVTSITNGGTWKLRKAFTNGNARTEIWATQPNQALAATTVSIAFSGTNDGVEAIVAAYTGVMAFGNAGTASGSAANPSIALATQDPNNFIVAGFGISSTAVTVAPTAGTGNLRAADAISAAGVHDGASALNDNTSATAGSVTNTVTYSVGSSVWAAVALELRSVAGAVARAAEMPTMAATRGLMIGVMAVHTTVGFHAVRASAVTRKPLPLPVVEPVRTPPPVTRSVLAPHVLRGAPQRKPFLQPVVVDVRTPAPVTRSVIGRSTIKVIAAPARVIVDPTTTLVRTPAPTVRSVTGKSIAARARVLVARVISSQVRIQPPKVESIVGFQLPRVAAPATSRARPVTVLVRTPKPVTDSTIGAPRPRVVAPAPVRPRPRVILIRLPLPRIFSRAGSGIARGSAVTLQLAIARSDGKISISLGVVATTALVQNTATTRLGVSDSATTALGWQNSAVTPLDTSE